jgi:hypothetical protein
VLDVSEIFQVGLDRSACTERAPFPGDDYDAGLVVRVDLAPDAGQILVPALVERVVLLRLVELDEQDAISRPLETEGRLVRVTHGQALRL